MMKIHLLCCFLSFPLFLFAQHRVQGSLVDEAGKGIDAVTCVLMNRADSLAVDAVVTDEQGVFTFGQVAPGEYFLSFRHLAFERVMTDLKVGAEDLVLSPYSLKSSGLNLDEVIVRGERPLVKAEAGKLIFDVPQLIQDKIATNAFETLRALPNVTGLGDEIQLVGASGYTILLNGQKSSMTSEQLVQLLKSMPASRVVNIEVMYSAPPEYNVRGAAINIVLADRQAELPLFQGEGKLLYRLGKDDTYAASASLLYSKPNYSIDFILGGNTGNTWSKNRMFAIHQMESRQYDILQNNRTRGDTDGWNTRLGLNYKLPNAHKLSLTYTGNFSHSDLNLTSLTDYKQDGNPYQTVDTRTPIESDDQLHNIKLDYESHRSLKAGIDYTFYKDPRTQIYKDYIEEELQQSYQTKTEQKISRWNAYVNHSSTVFTNWALTYGLNTALSRNNNHYDYYNRPLHSAPDSVSRTKQREYSASAFVGFQKSFSDKFSAQASVSLNYYRATADILREGKKTLWNDFEPFVNANLTYTFNSAHILQLSFTSDANYPPYWALSPNLTQMNAYSYVRGNPELKFSRKYEAQLVYILKSKYMLVGHYQYVPDNFTQLPYQSEEQMENVFEMVNFDYSSQYSLTAIVPVRVGKFWDARITLTGFRMMEKDDNFHGLSFKRSRTSFVAQMNNTFNLSSRPNLKLELAGYYMNGAIQGIYDIKSMTNVTAGIKWLFLNDKLELTGRVEDIFQTNVARTTIDYANQYSSMKVYPNAPLLSISLIYRFGGYKETKKEEVDQSRFSR